MNVSLLNSRILANMTQRQVEGGSCGFEDFYAVQWEQNQVICQLNERFSLVVKRYNQDAYLLLQSGRKCLKLPFDVVDAI